MMVQNRLATRQVMKVMDLYLDITETDLRSRFLKLGHLLLLDIWVCSLILDIWVSGLLIEISLD